MTIDKLKPGMVVYDVHSHVMGNTTMRTVGIWEVRIIGVDPVLKIVTASWNHNEPMKFHSRSFKKWRLKKPILIKSGMGHRLATREETKHTAWTEADL